MQQEIVKKTKVTPVYWANKAAYESERYRRIVNEGGSRSSKSFSIVQLLITIAKEQQRQISICSPSLPHLKKGVRKDFLDIMEEWGWFKEDHFNRTDNQYKFGKGYIEFFGVENAERVRGPGRDILFINEANLISEAAYRQLAMRTKQTVFLDYNPADEFSWVYPVADSKGSKIIQSTYLNNLANLPKWQVEEIESLQDADLNLWKVFGLGLRGTSAETIYTHWKSCRDLPNKGDQFFGLDFGYNNPTALVLCEFYEGVIYAQEWLYQSKLTTSDLIDEMISMGVRKSLEIFADCVEPKTIEEIARAGFTIKAADKDVREGIRKVRGTPLRITEGSANILKEIKSYKWKKDKNDKVLDEPVKFNDHCMDAIRYAVFTKLTGPQADWVAF